MRIEQAIVQQKFKNKSERLVVNLIYTTNWLEAHMHQMLKPYKISQSQYNVLRILRGQYPNVCNLNLIQERMLDKMSNSSRLIDKLVSKDFVKRNTCPTDRRQVNIKITDRGLLLLTDLDKKMLLVEKLTSNLNVKEHDLINDLLNKLRN